MVSLNVGRVDRSRVFFERSKALGKPRFLRARHVSAQYPRQARWAKFGANECRFVIIRRSVTVSPASQTWDRPRSLVYSPVTQIRSLVIRLKGSIEHWGGGPLREDLWREVRGCNCCLDFLFVRERKNRRGKVSCLGDRGCVIHILYIWVYAKRRQ